MDDGKFWILKVDLTGGNSQKHIEMYLINEEGNPAGKNHFI